MKKIFGFILMTFFALSFLPAQDADDDDEGGFGKPSISVENELTVKGQKSEKKDEKGKFSFKEIENETTAKFAVGFDLFEGFTLKPYISDVVAIGDGAKFKNNAFSIGLGASYQPMDMLSISFGAGYVSKWTSGGFKDDELGALVDTSLGNGVKANVGIGLEVASIFLEAGLEYKFSGMFATDNGKTAGDKDTSKKLNDLKNVIALDVTFDFFNFIKEDLNSGLVLSNETTIGSKWRKDNDGSETKVAGGIQKIENEFGVGLHFGMVKYMDFSFMTKVKSESTKIWNTGNKKYDDPSKNMTIGLSLGLAFEKDMFSFGVEYNPTLKTEEGKEIKEEHEHELKVTLGIAL